jgi:tripartite-type tricarboxylate transporter receptor subunit TctC
VNRLYRAISGLIAAGSLLALGTMAAAAQGGSKAGGQAAGADSYPSKVVKIIVGYAAGGNTDIPARMFAAEMQKTFGVPVIVENHPGASGVTAALAVSRTEPDGYTLIWGTSASHSVSVVTLAPLPFDPVKDFTPITLISRDPNVILVKNALDVKDLKGFLAYVKEHPDSAIGTAGPATSGRFAVELMKPKLGVSMTIVPYASTGPMLTDLLAGHIPFGITGASTSLPLIADKKIRPVAVTSLKRSAVLPDIPTFNETVSPGFDAVAWSALYGPPGMPQPIVAKLNAVMRKIAVMPKIKKWFDDSGLDVPMSSPEELTTFMAADIAKWVQVAKDNNLKMGNK